MNLINVLREKILNLISYYPHTAAQDKKVPPARVFTGGASSLVQVGLLGTTKFKNVIYDIAFPFNDSVCGKKKIYGIFTRTTPVDDTDYANLDIGSFGIFLTVASTVVTNAQIFIKDIDGFSKLLTTGGQNEIVATATAARATATGRWTGLRVKSSIPTGIDCSAVEQHGIYIETETLGTGKCGTHYGLKLETYVESGATCGDHYGIGIFTYDNRAGSNQLHVIRLEHNGANVGNAFLGCFNANGKISHFMETTQVDGSTWCGIATTPTCGTAAGWWKVKHGGYTRYVQLYSAVS